MAAANVGDSPPHSDENPPMFHKELFQKGALKEEYLSGIAVDRFVDFKRSTAFFLTHVHTDHTEGLENVEFAQYLKHHDFKLYCSKGTQTFIGHKHPELMQQTVALKPGDPITITVSPVPPLPQPREQPGVDKPAQPYQVTVTAVDANHCFGSMSFLFEREIGEMRRRVFYTGDVRMDDDWLRDLMIPLMPFRPHMPYLMAYPLYQAFHDVYGNFKEIDVVYLDATFILQPEFPSKFESCDKVIELIKQHRNDDTCVVVLSLTAQFSAEDIMLEIYRKTGMQVNVEDDVYKVYAQDEVMRKCITTDPMAKVYAWRPQGLPPLNAEIKYVLQRRNAAAKPNGVQKVLVIRASAMYFVINSGKCDVSSGIITCDYENVGTESRHVGFRVLASSHSARSELFIFLGYVKPREARLITVCDGVCVEDAKHTEALKELPEFRQIGKRVMPPHEYDARRSGVNIDSDNRIRIVEDNLSELRISSK